MELSLSICLESFRVKGAALVAQWMRPCHCLGGRSISGQLDSIAEMVAMELLKKRGEGEGQGQVEGEVLDPKRPRHESALTEVTQLRLPIDTLLTALNTVLYDHMGFRGATDNYYDLNNSYIDKVYTHTELNKVHLYQMLSLFLGVREKDWYSYHTQCSLRGCGQEIRCPASSSEPTLFIQNQSSVMCTSICFLTKVNTPRHFLLMLPKCVTNPLILQNHHDY